MEEQQTFENARRLFENGADLDTVRVALDVSVATAKDWLDKWNFQRAKPMFEERTDLRTIALAFEVTDSVVKRWFKQWQYENARRMFAENTDYRTMATILEITVPTVRNWFKRYSEGTLEVLNRIRRAPQNGAESSEDGIPGENPALLRARQGRRLTDYPKTREEENALGSFIPFLKPIELTEAQKEDRLHFCYKYLRDDLDDWVFVDECIFDSCNDSGKYERNNAEPKEIVKTSNTATNVYFWGAVSKNNKYALVKIDRKLDSEGYIQLLSNNLLDQAKEREEKPFKLIQDNSAIHSSEATKAFLEEKQVETIYFPKISFDLSPFQVIWKIMKCKLKKIDCFTKEDVERNVLEIWANLSQDMIKDKIETYHRKMAKIIENQGEHPSELARKRRQEQGN